MLNKLLNYIRFRHLSAKREEHDKYLMLLIEENLALVCSPLQDILFKRINEPTFNRKETIECHSFLLKYSKTLLRQNVKFDFSFKIYLWLINHKIFRNKKSINETDFVEISIKMLENSRQTGRFSIPKSYLKKRGVGYYKKILIQKENDFEYIHESILKLGLAFAKAKKLIRSDVGYETNTLFNKFLIEIRFEEKHKLFLKNHKYELLTTDDAKQWKNINDLPIWFLPRIDSLLVKKIDDIDVLNSFYNLRYIWIEDAILKKIPRFDFPIEYLVFRDSKNTGKIVKGKKNRIKSLYISNSDLPPFYDFTDSDYISGINLSKINDYKVDFSNFGRNLDFISLYKCCIHSDLFKCNKVLKILHLNDVTIENNIEGEKLLNLKTLSLGNTNFDLSKIEFQELERIEISNYSYNLSLLESASNLKEVRILDMSLPDLKWLKGKKYLRQIFLDSVILPDFGFLSYLHDSYVSFSNLTITDAKTFPNNIHCDIGFNNVRFDRAMRENKIVIDGITSLTQNNLDFDLSNIGFSKLESLDLNNYKRNNLSVLSKAKNLQYLTFSNMTIADLSWIEKNRKLKYITFDNVIIDDYNFLSKLSCSTLTFKSFVSLNLYDLPKEISFDLVFENVTIVQSLKQKLEEQYNAKFFSRY